MDAGFFDLFGFAVNVLSAALATEGLIWLAIAVVVLGMERGFAGFGSALVCLPLAGKTLPRAASITGLPVFDG